MSEEKVPYETGSEGQVEFYTPWFDGVAQVQKTNLRYRCECICGAMLYGEVSLGIEGIQTIANEHLKPCQEANTKRIDPREPRTRGII